MRKNIFKTTVIAMAVLTLAFGMTACGKKNNTASDNTTATAEAVTTADNNNTKKTSKVVFDYTDADGVTTKLEGNATVNDNGEAVIEVIDNNGNKAVFTGKASTDNGKLSVSDIKVKDAGTLVKTDGTEVKVSEGTKIENATESTDATKADIAAKDEPKEDTIVADGSDSNVSEGNENAGDNGNVSDTPSNEPVETPDVPNTPSEPEYVPDVPSEPEPTPEEPQPEEPAPAEPVITKVNPFDGKTYTYVAPEDMDYSLSGWSTINGNVNKDWDYSYEFKVPTIRTFYQLDGTYTTLEGWYCMSGDFTATPLQMGYDKNRMVGYTPVGWLIDDGDYTKVLFLYLKP